MAAANLHEGLERIQAFIKPWHASLANPAKAQEQVLCGLLVIYAQTEDGQRRQAGRMGSLRDFRQGYPIRTYEDYQPFIHRVMGGETSLLLNEAPVGWAITRGTRGENKFIPMTPTDLRMRVAAGRAVINYAASNRRFDIFEGVNLNLNFPSVVGKIKVGTHEVTYGYSSGIYTRHVSMATPVRSVPTQDEIDALGGGKTQQDWNSRFELAYQKCKELNVTLVGGVAPTAIDFGRYLKRQHGMYPKAVWKTQIMTLGSVPGINTRLEPALRAMYGPAAVREIYGATEGMFGQQMDEKRAWAPNYDLFFFEVQTKSGLKQLHEMHPGETGSLVVSTPVLARYHIGDTILAVNPPYFRTIGRNDWWTPLRYLWGEVSDLRFGRL